jgi:REP-associated tyrosine transposase
MRTNKPEHLKAFDYVGIYQYFLTFCAFERARLFMRGDAVSLVRTQIERAAAEQRFALLAYCFMPDHVHLLIEGQTDDADCREFIARAKQYAGFYYRSTFGRRLWQRYGYERVLRSDEAAVSVARYVLENPIRARLVERIDEYPFSGSSVYTMDQLIDAVQLGDHWYSCPSGGQRVAVRLKPDATSEGPAKAGHYVNRVAAMRCASATHGAG